MIKETMEFLSQYDPEVGATIEKEYHREQRNIELIASENIVSPAVNRIIKISLRNILHLLGNPVNIMNGFPHQQIKTEDKGKKSDKKTDHISILRPHSVWSEQDTAITGNSEPILDSIQNLPQNPLCSKGCKSGYYDIEDHFLPIIF